MENKLTILSESLDKKIQVLREIQEYNDKQEQAFKNDEADLDSFDKAVEEKGQLIDKLNALDDGFEILYAEIAGELQDKKEQYASRIRELQEKIRLITELGTSVQAQEARNKKLVEEYFARARKGIQESRRSSQAAYDYYRSMRGPDMKQSQFLDSKK